VPGLSSLRAQIQRKLNAKDVLSRGLIGLSTVGPDGLLARRDAALAARLGYFLARLPTYQRIRPFYSTPSRVVQLLAEPAHTRQAPSGDNVRFDVTDTSSQMVRGEL
jgi:hypothetical protein